MTDDAPSTIVAARKPSGSDGGDLRARVPAITILWHYDLGRVGQRAPLAIVGTTEVSRYTPPFDQVADVVLSRHPFLFVDHHEGSVTLRPASTKTTVVVDGIPLSAPLHIAPDELGRGVIITLADQIVMCVHRLRTPVLRGAAFGIVGTSDIMEDVRRQIDKVANLDLEVLIQGESGTGKELVARAIALNSTAPKPFVAINMGNIPVAMATAELFGHEKGAFTGAAEARPGVFVEADGGTLFLDEIASTPIEVQKMLLRVLQDKEVRPVGARRTRTVKVRVLTATDKDLKAAVAQGTFERALFERIAKYQIELPPLRERREDVGALFLHFLREQLATTAETSRLESRNAEERPWLNASDFARIARSSFPGNVRSLTSIASQLVVSSRGHPFAKIDSVLEKVLSPDPAPDALRPVGRRPGLPTNAEIENAFRRYNYNFSAAAAHLGIHRNTLHEWAVANPGSVRKAESIPEGEILGAFARHAGDIGKMATELRVSPKPLKSRLDDVLRRQRAR